MNAEEQFRSLKEEIAELKEQKSRLEGRLEALRKERDQVVITLREQHSLTPEDITTRIKEWGDEVEERLVWVDKKMPRELLTEEEE